MTDRTVLRIAVTGVDDEDTGEATIALGEVLAELPIDTMERLAGGVASPGTAPLRHSTWAPSSFQSG